MEFPVHVFGLHPHWVFDALSLFVGSQLFWWLRRRTPAQERWSTDRTLSLAAGCILGAFLGAKLIVLLEDPATTLRQWRDPLFWAGGKSIVGALLGGLAGVEVAKKLEGMKESTGDAFVVPLCVGLAIGRVGCYLSGLEDDTFGTDTSLPWGVDFGDGMPRHPTQLYEIAFALLFLAALPALRRRQHERGDAFRLFMVSYFAFRFVEELVRVSPRPYLGLTVYQVACLGGLAYYLHDRGTRGRLARMTGLRRRDTAPEAPDDATPAP